MIEIYIVGAALGISAAALCYLGRLIDLPLFNVSGKALWFRAYMVEVKTSCIRLYVANPEAQAGTGTWVQISPSSLLLRASWAAVGLGLGWLTSRWLP